ncbi:ABC-type Fe3+-hydroxamate transport system, periplasmic component [Corynebacterium mustelae]|uniref:ABC-type Fe3+-hydroxamate transport system, periplasmic component n=1 Tax=Corynebacterium mustelae TaxID=571915 RepID=A0A0G3GYS9_9CORY|nr:ABC transporter substrate-binding protein [Corynebacterium mustelae]AKK05665.1 ABC-type Fe3+-hydroxamate transport system, periplasmic component [Corynebacterium mustelae]
MRIKKAAAVIALSSVVLSACSDTGSSTATSASGEAGAAGGITIENCGQEVTYEATDDLFVNDGNIISIALAAGAKDNIKYVSSVQRDMDILKAKYGADVEKLNDVAKEYPSLEEVVSKQPDIFVAGWNYGFNEGKNLTPETLKEQGISSYILTESCRQDGTDKRGIVDPWEAVEIDVNNLGAMTGNEETAQKVVADQQERLAKLKEAQQPEKAPVAFVFDSASDTIFTSGSFGAPEAIITAAGAKNAASDIKDTWTTVGWEHLTANTPDVFVFVEYPGQEFDEKVKILKEHPTTKDLPAVKENRFINLPYAMWTSGPLNIDAAEHVRKGLEKFGLAPESDIKPQLELPESVPGKEYFQ